MAMTPRDQYHHGNLREALVDAACAVVAESGVQGLSLRAVARRAGVSQAAPYHHFDSKEALVAEVCCRGFEELGRRTAEAISGLESAIDQLEAMARAYLRFAVDRPDLFGIMWGGEGLIEDKTPYTQLTETAGSSLQQLVAVVQLGMERGELRAGDPIDAALAAWAGVHGAAALIRDRATDSPKMCELGITPDRIARAVMDTVVRGLS